MSSITFPYGNGHSNPGSSSFISVHDSASVHSHMSSYEPPTDTSSFQMNPLSSHPPRTPRSSIMSNNSHVSFGAESVYDRDTKEDAQVTEVDAATDDSEEEEDEAESARSGVRKEEVWRELLKSSNGRDKALVRHFASCYAYMSLPLRVRRLTGVEYRNYCSTR